jgi:predicted GH43/DUF377 family glycosyl hydrolase
MNSQKIIRTLFLGSCIFFFLTEMPKGQRQNLVVPFFSPVVAENVDYQSFPSQLMLKHTIGRFTKLPKNPVLTYSANGWDKDDVSDPFVYVTADSVYLFYDGSSHGKYNIGYAVRDPSGWFWVKRKKLLNQSDSQWDSFHQVDPNVLNVNGTWRLYYSGNQSDSEFGYQIGLAEKNEAGDWFYPVQIPVFPMDTTSWDFAGNIYVNVHYFPELKKFKMWYTGFQGPFSAIGLAESDNGLKWQKIGDGPVLNVFPGVIAPSVIYNGEKYIMYFVQLNLSSGFGTKIFRAESTDGIHWENFEEILRPGAKWEGRRLMRPNISYFEGKVHLYYCGQKGSRWQIGEAFADAQFSENGVWRSEVIKKNAGSLQIKFEQPQGTLIKAYAIDLKSGTRSELPLFNQTKPLRTNVYSSTISGLNIHGEWQLELELETTVENRSPVIYEINVN